MFIVLKIWQNSRQGVAVPLTRKASEVILAGWIKTEGKDKRLKNGIKINSVIDSFWRARTFSSLNMPRKSSRKYIADVLSKQLR